MDETLVKGITVLQAKGFQYLSFGLIGTSIELLGFFFDGCPLEDDNQGRDRFNSAIDNLFLKISPKYKRTCPCKRRPHDDFCLYAGLRCGMAHIGRPQNKIVFTTREEAGREKHTHLDKDPLGHLVLVAEDLRDDFVAAWNALKRLSSDGMTQKSVTDAFLNVYTY